MAKIFISYRRDDSAYATGVIRDALAYQLPGCEIFLDVDSIPYGVDFRQHLEACVGECDFLVAVIGKQWLTVTNSSGQRRIDDPNDAVHVEVETALRREIPLIPVFLDGINVPQPDELPDPLRKLVARNAIFVRPPPDFNSDVEKLVQAFHKWLAQEEGGETEAAPAASPAAPQTPPTAAASPHAQVSHAQTLPLHPATHPKPTSRRGLVALAAVLVAGLAAAAWYALRPAPPLSYEFSSSYLFEDNNATPEPWKPHDHMVGGGFKMPVNYVHWVIRLEHPLGIERANVPLEVRLLDESGEVVKFSGLHEQLPDVDSPTPGQAEWIATVGGRNSLWHPGKYILQLNTPEGSVETTFEVFEE